MNPRAMVALGLALFLGGMAVVTAGLLLLLRAETGPGFMGLTRASGGAETGEVRTTSYEVEQHVQGDVDYREDPPMGGEHADYWHACGSFDHPLLEEAVVHALEHGTVWIAHDPGLDPSKVGTLDALLPDEGILAPRAGLPGDVVVTVWNAQLALEDVDVPAIEAFLDEYGDGHTSPEPFASCHGGLEVGEDGTVLDKGGSVQLVAG